MASLLASSSTSCAISFSSVRSNGLASSTSRRIHSNPLASVASGHPSDTKTSFLGERVQLGQKHHQRNATSFKASLKVEARGTGGGKQFEVEVEKPLGLNLGAKKGGGVVVTGVIPGSNGAKAGIKTGDQVVYTSSFFGDELWPSDNVGFTQSAVRAKSDSVYFVIARGVDVNVKRLPKRPAPSRFGRTLTEAQKSRATHICLDCGFIYTLPKPFDEQPSDFECPQCSAPKKRFVPYDPETGRAIGGGSTPLVAVIAIALGVAAIAAFSFYGFQ